jgi:prepilin-type N-terminal cleavage/methylation domain-containing protein
MHEKQKSAFTLMEILVVTAIIGLISAIGIPAFMNSYIEAKIRVKQANVSAVDAAKDQWALLNNEPNGTTVTWDDIDDYMGSGVDEQADLDVDGDSISINPIGTSASY